MTGTGGSRLWRRRRLLLGLPVGALIAFALGVVAWIGFHASLEASNSLTFCTSCHEMATFVYPE